MNRKFTIAIIALIFSLAIFLLMYFQNNKFSLNNNLPVKDNSLECQKVRDIVRETAYSVDETLCKQCGGYWGLGPDDAGCNPQTLDSNKPCTDNSQCEGLCLTESENATKGKCSPNKFVFGCNIEIVKGEVQLELCRD